MAQQLGCPGLDLSCARRDLTHHAPSEPVAHAGAARGRRRGMRRQRNAASTSPRAVGGRAVGCGWMTGLFSVAGKTALVTGGSRGIGLMIARGLGDPGARAEISSRKAAVGEGVAASGWPS